MSGEIKSPGGEPGLQSSRGSFDYILTQRQISEQVASSEQYVLGGILLNPELVEKAINKLNHSNFNDNRNGLIFMAVEELHRKGDAVDEFTVFEYLRQRQLVEKVPVAYFGVLKDAFVSEANFDSHLDRVRQAADARKELELFERIKQARANGTDSDTIEKYCNQLKKLWEGVNGKGSDLEIIEPSGIVPTEPKWTLETLVPEGYPTTCYSDGGIGKSFLATYWAILAAMGGQMFLGLKFPQEPVNVLFLDWELEINEFTRRALKISKGLDIPGIPSNLKYINPGKNLTELLNDLPRLISTERFGLIIIDSLGAAGFAEPKTEDITHVFNKLKSLGVTTLLIDHQSKLQFKDSYDLKKPFGSAYKYNLSRSVCQLSVIDRSDNTVSLMLSHKKSNFGRQIKPLYFDISFEGDRVIFLESQALTPEEKDILAIHEAMIELEEKGERINQKNIVLSLKGVLGRNSILSLLEKGEGKFWEKVSQNKRDFVYRPISLKIPYIYKRTTKLIGHDDFGDGIDAVPEVIK